MDKIKKQDWDFQKTAKTAAYSELGVGLLALVTASGTLVCCALPVLLVTLGMGVVVSGLVGSLPFLVALTHYKVALFVISAGLLGLSGGLLYRPGRTCPSDPNLAATCERLQRGSRRVFWVSVVLWCFGFFASFLLLPIRKWLFP